MSMKLHIMPASPPSRKPMALIAHLGLPVQMVVRDVPNLSKDATYLEMNPNGKVPTLEDGKTYVWESNSILRYLAEKSGSDLWPNDVAAQRDVLQWQFWEASHFGPAVMGVFFQRVLKAALNLGPIDEAQLQEKLGFAERFCKVLDKELAKRDYICGSKPTIADFSIGVMAQTAKAGSIDLSPYKHIEAWLQRMSKLKGWEESFPSMETKLPKAA